MSALGPLIIGIDGHALDAATTERLLDPNVGGVILFARNHASTEQLKALCEQIKALRDPRLLICVDQEGGRVQRLQTDFTRLPPLALLGRWYQRYPDRALDLAYRHGRVMAAEVLACGVDFSWAPVLDLGGISEVIGDRAMSDDPEAVIALAKHYLAGMADAGMVGCAKHYPGHGSVRADTHTDEAVDDRPVEALWTDEAPFRAVMGSVPLVMMSHVIYPALAPEPAGFSKTWIQSRLRETLGFDGLVVSDDLDMVGAHRAGGLPERLSAAFEAGCDLALVCEPQSVIKVLDRQVNWPTPCPKAMAKLVGRAMLSWEEQMQVSEFRFWRQSLAQLAEESR